MKTVAGVSSDPLPPAWLEALARDQQPGQPLLADPLPERRIARLLAAFIATGLVFLVLPGTLLGVWNLLAISARRRPEAGSAAWIQAHGHAQLFGWVTSFMLGISLYAFPKFRGRQIRSLPVGWLMLAMWTIAVSVRWASAVSAWHWQWAWPASGVLELAVAGLLVWQCTSAAAVRRTPALWEIVTFAGFFGLIAALALQLVLLWKAMPASSIPQKPDQLLVGLALWIFCFPVVWGFSIRLLPAFLGLRPSSSPAAYSALVMLAAAAVLLAAGEAAWGAWLIPATAAAACWSLRVFHPPARPPKLAGVEPLYPLFVRIAYGWLIVSSILESGAPVPGFMGASRHAFTVGFLATMIFSIGPRILPAFLNSRELWSVRLMRWSLLLLTAGCSLRVVLEPLAYARLAPGAWRALPVSAFIELSAVLLFALNIGKTLATPIPTWFGREQVKGTMMLYWYVSSYPATRQLLIAAGITTLKRTRNVPKTLTLAEAAQADGADLAEVLGQLGDFFEALRTRTSRTNAQH